MDLLLILTYAGFCVAIFKIFNIPLTKWTVPTAILGGVIIIGALLLLMNYNHPYAKYAKEVFVSVPMIPPVRGVVVSVNVEPNTRVEQGDVLFSIDPVPYELEVVRLQAQLSDAGQGVLQEEEVWKSARAGVAAARADRDRSKQVYDRYLAGGSAFSANETENRRQLYLAAEAKLEAAQAQEQQAKLSLESEVDGEDATVAQIRAALRNAEYNLEQTVVRAPADGMVTQLALRPGMMVVPAPLRPALVFIPDESRQIAASFWQNSMRLIEPGQEAEFIIDAVPGHIFKGTVVQLLPAMSEGEFQSGGTLISAKRLAQHGRGIAIIQLEEDLTDYNLPLGVQGKGAIYTDNFSHVSVMRKVLLRMVGWLNYVYPIK